MKAVDLPTVANMSPDEFAAKLGDAGLVARDEIQSAMDTLASGSSLVDGQGLAKYLVHEGKLTSFQAAAVLEARADDLRIGNYDVLERLGAGAMGTVYRACHRRMKRIVALKVLSKSLAGDTFVKRFQREVETLAQLTHPNIVMAFDADESANGPYLVMEFVDGKDLASIVQKKGTLAVPEAIDVILQAARGLDYAHKKNIIHRDIKPANIMRDNTGVVKVADVGLARLQATQETVEISSLTQAGGIVGTMDYMPPEQAVDSTTIDLRADIYSLGCTLYYLLNGKAPYQGTSIMAILLKHREAPIPRLSERSDIPPALDALFQKMVAKQPDQRPANMAEVVRSLEAIAAAPPAERPAPNMEATLIASSTAELEATNVSSSVTRTLAELVIILVEPSRTQAGIIRRFLEQLGAKNVHVIGAGKQAVELAKQHHADAVISSMHLADMTGMALAHTLREDADCAKIGFILTTSGSESDDLSSLKEMHHTVLMPKPFDATKLTEALLAATAAR